MSPKKEKTKRQRAPGGGRKTIYQGVELVKISLLLTQAQIDYLGDKGKNGSASDGARTVVTRDMARDLEKSQ